MRTRAAIEADEPLRTCFGILDDRNFRLNTMWAGKRLKWHKRMYSWGWDSVRILLETPAGQKFEEVSFGYLDILKKVEDRAILQSEAEGALREMGRIIKGLWLEAHSQAGLITDMAQLSSDVLRRAEEASRYLGELDRARRELRES